MALYKLLKSSMDGSISAVLKQSDPNLKISIPFSPDNSDYQEYLEWVEAGNTPDPAD